jgi:hypothetical protein
MRSVERISSSGRETPADDVRQRLRDLPIERHPPYDWTEFTRRSRERALIRRSPVKWEHAAAVAGVTVLIASMAIWGRADQQQAAVAASGVAAAPISASASPSATAASTTDNAMENERANYAANAMNERLNAAARERAQAASIAAQAMVAAQLAALRRSQESRQWLEQQPDEPAVVRVGARAAVASLEDRIAWVDDALSDAQFGSVNRGGMQALERERAQLVSSLARVRYAQTLASVTP